MVPVVIKSATIAPSIVIASPYSPLYPVFEYPNPFRFHLHTLRASSGFFESIISNSDGFPSSSIFNTMYPFVACLIISDAFCFANCKILLSCGSLLLILFVAFDCCCVYDFLDVLLNTIVFLSGSDRYVTFSCTGNHVFIPKGSAIA